VTETLQPCAGTWERPFSSSPAHDRKTHYGGHEIRGMTGKHITGKRTQKLTDPSPILTPSSPTACLLQGQACTYSTPSAYTCNDKSPSFPAGCIQLAPNQVSPFSYLPCPAQVALAPIPHISHCHCPACCLSQLHGWPCSAAMSSALISQLLAMLTAPRKTRRVLSDHVSLAFCQGLPVSLASRLG